MFYCWVIKARKCTSWIWDPFGRDCVAYTIPIKSPYGSKLPTVFFSGLCTYLSNAKFLVPMRLGDTPVPIPNTTVKTQSADGTALETVWESRWLPDQKERNRRSCLIKIERALESELCRKQSGTRRFSISPVLTLNQSGRTVIIAGFYQWSEFTKTVCEFWWLIKHQSALYLENCIHEIWLS